MTKRSDDPGPQRHAACGGCARLFPPTTRLQRPGGRLVGDSSGCLHGLRHGGRPGLVPRSHDPGPPPHAHAPRARAP